MLKKDQRLRRARRARSKIKELREHRLCVFRTPRHIYAQVIHPAGNQTVAAASTLSPAIRSALKATGNAEAAALVGSAIAESAIAAGVKKVAFDRSGFRYHGRVKELAEAARAGGLEF